jgi:hypothetical protein
MVRTAQCAPTATGIRRWWGWGTAVVIGSVAIFLRVSNLGTFSLWLDEIFTMRAASLPILDTLRACADDAENVPVYAVVANLGLKVGLHEPWIRLLPIAAGLASIALLAVWTRRHFDRGTALLVAAFCALSTFHIRYSQELRAYPYLLLVCTATLLLTDRLRSRPDWRSTLALAATVAVGCYTNLTYVLVLVPVTGMVLIPLSSGRSDSRSLTVVLRQFVIAVGLGVLAFAPWIWWIWPTLTTRLSRTRITEWSLLVVGQRWQGLTIARGHYDLITWFGFVLAVVFVIGMWVAFRMKIGRAVLLPAVATLIAWEAVLVAIRHWSASRYDTALWPFLAVLLALGFGRILGWMRWRWLQWATCTFFAAILLYHVDEYQRFGRPHWDVFAEAVTEVRRPGESVIAVDDFDERSLDYYLDEPVVSINGKPRRLRDRLEATPSVLVFSRRPIPPEYLEMADTWAELANIQTTARLYRLSRTSAVRPGPTPDGGTLSPGSWPEPVAEPVSEGYQRPPPGLLGRLGDPPRQPPSDERLRVDFDPREAASLPPGWAQPTTRDDGTTRSWVIGREARVDLSLPEPVPGRIEIRLRPHPSLDGRQWLRVLFNGHVVKEARLKPGLQIIGFGVPPRLWMGGLGVVTLQLSEVCCTEGKRRRRSAEVDWIAWAPRSVALIR